MMTKSLTNVIDLFAGAGGLSVGAHLAGAKVAASVELNATACQTLRANAKYHGEVVEGDVSALSGSDLRSLAGLKKREPLVIVGGPPCQPFSKAAYWTEAGDDAAYRRARASGVAAKKPPPPTIVKDDERRDLVMEFWRLVEEADAQGFVFENVPSLKHPRNRPLYDILIRKAIKAGFEITEITAKAVAYGVPQTRERIVVLGSRKRKPIPPQETHSSKAGDLLLPPPVTAGEALEGLGSRKYFEPEEVIAGRWADHLAEIPPGWNYKALTEWAGHPSPTFVAETRFWNFLLKLSPDRPSWTIAASPGPWTGPFHWKNRRLRTPELAALQGFPRGYIVEGSRRTGAANRECCARSACGGHGAKRTGISSLTMKKTFRPKVLSLFSGCGGLDIGLEAAGFSIAVATDIDVTCAESYRLNHPTTPYLVGSIGQISTADLLGAAKVLPGQLDLLAGGPPCPAFSKSRFYRKEKPRALDDPVAAETVGGYLRILREARPKAFLLENVKGLAYGVHRQALGNPPIFEGRQK